MGLNNPLPSGLGNECQKAARILTSFVNPDQSFGPDKVIPPSILANAKGLAILTVIKGGFLASVRVGSGLIIARLPDGTWSAPSAIGTAGAGFGGQIGAELTDFVMILNDANAVKTFSQAGSITLGGNVSIAAGPVGRNAEASGAASLRSVSGVFSYSKTKGLFAGVSLEGSVIVERKDANKKFYNGAVSASQLLGGNIPAPPAADALLRVLESRSFRSDRISENSMYNDSPVYDSNRDETVWEGRTGDAYGEGRRGGAGQSRNSTGSGVSRSSTWQDDVYDREASTYNAPRRSNTTSQARIGRASIAASPVFPEDGQRGPNQQFQRQYFQSTYSDEATPAPTRSSIGSVKQAPGRPTAPKPAFNKPTSPIGPNQAVALYTFEGDQQGDLSFKKGDIITITKRTDSANDWWTGSIGGRTGIFPR
ncbi:hypothetical protein DFH27DRAFT_640238 [Peziza echinospora]|nr:hypothetical protein DFH27DRAFT_640238 [Peziza echinospora]